MEMPRRFEVGPPRRVLFIGSPGAGAARLAKLASGRFSLPLIDLAQAPRQPEATWRDDLQALAEETDWAVAGFDAQTADILSRRAEWLMWIDLPVSSCFSAVVREHLKARVSPQALEKPPSGKRPSLWARLRQIAHYPAEVSPRIIATIERERRNRTIYILRTKREVREFAATIGSDFGGANRLNGKLK